MRAVDGTALVMTRLDRVERSHAVAHWSVLLHRAELAPARGELKWLHYLDADDQAECLQELWEGVESLFAGTIDPPHMQEILDGWRAAAVSLADDERRRVLLNGASSDDFVDAGRPE